MGRPHRSGRYCWSPLARFAAGSRCAGWTGPSASYARRGWAVQAVKFRPVSSQVFAGNSAGRRPFRPAADPAAAARCGGRASRRSPSRRPTIGTGALRSRWSSASQIAVRRASARWHTTATCRCRHGAKPRQLSLATAAAHSTSAACASCGASRSARWRRFSTEADEQLEQRNVCAQLLADRRRASTRRLERRASRRIGSPGGKQRMRFDALRRGRACRR